MSGNTLLRQFKQVVQNCEYIGSEVYGLVLDAGGKNARFVSMLHDLKKLPSSVWLDDDTCYIDNWINKSQRVYFWFCSTHIFKATRNQLMSSSQSGNKAFQDKKDVDFRWEYLMKLYRKVKDERRNSDGIVSYSVQLSEKFIDPKRQLKMNVSLEKRAMEDKTLSYGISKVIVELEMTAEDLAKHAAKAREKHRF